MSRFNANWHKLSTVTGQKHETVKCWIRRWKVKLPVIVQFETDTGVIQEPA